MTRDANEIVAVADLSAPAPRPVADRTPRLLRHRPGVEARR